MVFDDAVNILLVDDQASKLLTYEAILSEPGYNLIKASSAKVALEQLLKNEIAVILVDVCMPELNGFQLASMIHEHPRFQKIAMIFISAIHLAEIDHLRGYESGAVDYVPVPVVPEVLRAKVRVFTDLYRKSRQLERLNSELERRVIERTAELEASTRRLVESEQRRSLALAAGRMGSWDWDVVAGEVVWDEGQHSIFGVVPEKFNITPKNFKRLILPADWPHLSAAIRSLLTRGQPNQTEFRVQRPNGEVCWCASTAAASLNGSGKVVRIAGVTMDITDRKEAEERQALLAREVDHRAKNAMAIVQSFVRLTKANSILDYAKIIEGRVNALSRAHAILSDSRWQGADLTKLVGEELAPYRSGTTNRIDVSGRHIVLDPTTAQTLALALHELATNGAKYGALSHASGRLKVNWDIQGDMVVINWGESCGPPARVPIRTGFGTRIITSSIEGQLGGKAVFDWRPDGLQCVLQVPCGQTLNTRIDVGVHHSPQTSPKLFGRRILLVEDEALVAILLEEQLRGLGLSIVETCGSVREAMRAIDASSPDAAILDLNLGGESAFPVADRLEQSGIPFVFVTGYCRESIDKRYSHICVLEKPIERHSLEMIFAKVMGNSPRIS